MPASRTRTRTQASLFLHYPTGVCRRMIRHCRTASTHSRSRCPCPVSAASRTSTGQWSFVTDSAAQLIDNDAVTPESLSRTVQEFLAEAAGAVVLEDGALAFDLAQARYSI